VEDPAEQIVPGVMQTEICEARGLTFATAARHLLRQDPQVLVIGEMRDEETAAIAVRAALTGHLVISTLHAGSCQGVFERLLSLCPDHYSVFSAVELVLNQRLLRRLCPECSSSAGAEVTRPASNDSQRLLTSSPTGGCESCLHTGYRGRLPVVEWVRMDDALRQRLRAEGPAVVKPVQTLSTAARELVNRGQSDEKEFQRVIGE
jgi:type II secretory ATPase GspE/PulE/Tfp pilus assembly ATPase PilB-like protein